MAQMAQFSFAGQFTEQFRILNSEFRSNAIYEGRSKYAEKSCNITKIASLFFIKFGVNVQ